MQASTTNLSGGRRRGQCWGKRRSAGGRVLDSLGCLAVGGQIYHSNRSSGRTTARSRVTRQDPEGTGGRATDIWQLGQARESRDGRIRSVAEGNWFTVCSPNAKG
jgi:hypothetical protein